MTEFVTGRNLPETVIRTRAAVGTTLRRQDAQLVFAVVTLAYLPLYLFAIGYLNFGRTETALLMVADPLALLFHSRGPFLYEPIARMDLHLATLLFSPVNTLIGLGLGVLGGLNLAVTYLAWTQPKTCGIGASSAGLIAGIPAFLSGMACCVPILLVVLGIQASGLLLTGFGFLLPLAFVMLVGSLFLVGRQVQLDAVRGPVGNH